MTARSRSPAGPRALERPVRERPARRLHSVDAFTGHWCWYRGPRVAPGSRSCRSVATRPTTSWPTSPHGIDPARPQRSFAATSVTVVDESCDRARLVRRRPCHRRPHPLLEGGAGVLPGVVPQRAAQLPVRRRRPVPATIVRHRDVPLDGTAPCLLYGYGAYECDLRPEFDAGPPRACSTAASSSSTRTSAAAARAAGSGGWTAGSAPSSTRSTTMLAVAEDSRLRSRRRHPDRYPRPLRGRAAPGRGLLASAPTVARAWSPRSRSSTSSPPCSTRPFR